MKMMPFHGLRMLMAVAVGIAAALALNIPAVNGAVKNAVYSVLGPVQYRVWAAGANTRSFFDNLERMNNAAAENEKLKQQINDLMARVSEMDSIKRENDFLRQGLNLELDKDFDLKLANIVAKDVARDVIIIDKGSDDLVQEGMPVITSQRAIVGRVSKTYGKYSEVTLATAKDFSFDVKIGDEGIDGLVKGSGSSGALVNLVPKDKDLKEGATVSTSQMGGIFPGGLLVGTVSGVINSDVDTFQSAGLAPAFDVNKSRQVFVANGKLPLGFVGEQTKKSMNKRDFLVIAILGILEIVQVSFAPHFDFLTCHGSDG